MARSTTACSASRTYTPETDYDGPDSFTWHASDATDDSNFATFSIIIVPNSPPVATDQAEQTHTDEPLFINLAASDANDDDLTFVIDNGPDHGVLGDCNFGSCSYTPATGYQGADAFTWHANDGTADSNVGTVSITIATNLPPMADDQAGQTKIDLPLNVDLEAADAEFEALTFVIDSGPSHGSLGDCTFGSCIYTPATGYQGLDSFTWYANDGASDSNVATFSITIAPNTPPVATDDAYTVAEASQTELGLTSNDTDANFDTLTITGGQYPSAQSGTVDCTDGLSCLYAPALGFTGIDTFAYTIDDGDGGSDSATVTVTVEPCPVLTGALGDAGLLTGQEWVACSSTTAHAASGSNLTPLFTPVGPTLALMTTGSAALADGPNDDSGAGRDNGTQLRGAFDVSILRLDLTVPQAADCLAFSVLFASEEYPEFVGSPFNDGFAAELDTSTWSVSGSTITAPDNFAFDLAGDVISVNSSFFDSDRVETDNGMQYDGATALLQAQTPVTPGAHSLYLSIFDAGDPILDSAVLIDDLRAYAAGDAGCSEGAGQLPVAVDDDGITTNEDVPVNIDVLANDTDADGDPLTVIAVSIQPMGQP